MSYRLKNRFTGVPQAIRFHQPELKWSSRPGSFDNIVGQIVRVRLANPAQAKKHGWSTDAAAVANELDAYMAKICVDNGWNNFVQTGVGDSPVPPQARPGPVKRPINAVAGVDVQNDWISPRAAESKYVTGDVYQEFAKE